MAKNRERFIKTGQNDYGEVDGFWEPISDAEEEAIRIKETEWPPDFDSLTDHSSMLNDVDATRILRQCVEHIVALEQRMTQQEYKHTYLK